MSTAALARLRDLQAQIKQLEEKSVEIIVQGVNQSSEQTLVRTGNSEADTAMSAVCRPWPQTIRTVQDQISAKTKPNAKPRLTIHQTKRVLVYGDAMVVQDLHPDSFANWEGDECSRILNIVGLRTGMLRQLCISEYQSLRQMTVAITTDEKKEMENMIKKNPKITLSQVAQRLTTSFWNLREGEYRSVKKISTSSVWKARNKKKKSSTTQVKKPKKKKQKLYM